MYIAFYKKQKTFFEKLIKFFTKSQYVHCELVTFKLNNKFYGYTSMPGYGVMARWREYNPDEWDFVNVNFSINDINDFYNRTFTKKYDYLGVLGIVLGIPQDPNRYFCSEWCAEFLGYEHPWEITPGMLYSIATYGKKDETNETNETDKTGKKV